MGFTIQTVSAARAAVIVQIAKKGDFCNTTLMGAGGHCVIISGDAREFLHVHPLEEVGHDWRGGPEVAFQATFPRAGPYRIWGQFQHKGEVLTESFTVIVSQGD